ncbi:unnamed protein product [Paramecium pentaurelia]|uniref:Uncharacterized protein n=1 Tax=Paramecium pentaurelia TaxID=43138 RepID=A0A8S1UWX8_9CILI|nr:unnamed protein product [Paramecium pentaurelia]
MICLFLAVKQFSEEVQRNFRAEGYLKFKNQASKFQGSIATSVFQYETVQTDNQEALNKIPQFFVYILSLSSNQLNGIWVMSWGQKIEESILAVKDILEVVIKDYFIPALILDQFFLIYVKFELNIKLNTIGIPQIFLILSKVRQKYLKEKFKCENLKFYQQWRFQKIEVIQHSLGVFLLQQILFQKLIKHKDCFLWELNQMIQQDIKQILNIFLILMYLLKSAIQFLQIQIESSNVQQMQVCVERNNSLTAFIYSYFQMIQQYKDRSLVVQQKTLKINENFLKLDRYNFDQYYFEVSGNLNLNNCQKLFEKFDQQQVSSHQFLIMQKFRLLDFLRIQK